MLQRIEAAARQPGLDPVDSLKVGWTSLPSLPSSARGFFATNGALKRLDPPQQSEHTAPSIEGSDLPGFDDEEGGPSPDSASGEGSCTRSDATSFSGTSPFVLCKPHAHLPIRHSDWAKVTTVPNDDDEKPAGVNNLPLLIFLAQNQRNQASLKEPGVGGKINYSAAWIWT